MIRDMKVFFGKVTVWRQKHGKAEKHLFTGDKIVVAKTRAAIFFNLLNE
jgi:hypothetical protein